MGWDESRRATKETGTESGQFKVCNFISHPTWLNVLRFQNLLFLGLRTHDVYGFVCT